MTQPSWLRDEPLDLRKDDKFGVSPIADRLVGLLAVAKPPFTLSLSGAWGVGKSTLASAIVTRLKDRDIRAAKVDAWTQDVKQLRRNTVIEVGAALRNGTDADRKVIAEELDQARVTHVEVESAHIEARELWATVKQLYRSWFAYLIALLLLSIAIYQAVTLDKDSGLRPFYIALGVTLTSILSASILFKFVTPSASRAPASEDVGLATKFEEVVTKRPVLFGYKGPVVVVIDNLDRLSGSDALIALSQIRALVEIPESRCIFFIPIDRTRLAAHLARELNDPRAAADYLEKFFNLDLQLAQPEPIDLHDWAYTETSKLFQAASEADKRSVAEMAVSAADRSPRTVIRILNGGFTRYESLGQTDVVGVRQLVFVEGVVTIAPQLVEQLAAEPRAFVEARQQFGIRNGIDWQTKVLRTYLEGHPDKDAEGRSPHEDDYSEAGPTFGVERLRAFLAANPDISVSPEQLRLALTLREDRFWKDVTESVRLQEALETGDATAFRFALEGRAKQDRLLAITRSVQLIERNLAFRRIAARALDAVVIEAAAEVTLSERLHRAALMFLGEAEPTVIASLTRPSIEFVFGQRREANDQGRMRTALMAAIQDRTVHPLTSLVVAAKTVADLLDQEDIDTARERFSSVSLSEQEPIFEDPPSVALAQGPVAARLCESLGTWTVSSSEQDQMQLRAQRLTRLMNAGWEGQSEITALATKFVPLISEITASDEVLASLDAVTKLMATAQPSTELDQFGIQLSARRAVDEYDLFRYALKLPLSPSALAAVGAQIQIWLQTASTVSIQRLLDDSGPRVDEALPSHRQLLLDLWEAKGDVRFAALAVGADPTRLEGLATKWEALTPQTALEQARPALTLTASVGNRQAVENLINRIVAKLPSIPFANLTSLQDLAEWLVHRNFERRSLAIGLEAKVRAATSAAEITAIAPQMIAVAELLGGRQRAGLVEALSETFINLNTGDPEEVAWLVRHLTTHSSRERLSVQLVERSLELGPTLTATDQARSHFDSSQVFEALVSRAGREADELNAQACLNAAASWKRPPADAKSDYEASLRAVGEKFPALKDQTERLMSPAPNDA